MWNLAIQDPLLLNYGHLFPQMFLGNDDKDAISTILQREHLVAIVKMPESEVYDESMPSRQHSPMQKEVFSESSLLL